MTFELYLRTGRRSPTRPLIETKFNPWHDPEDGRFTFAGQGRNFAGGPRGAGAGSAGRARPRRGGDSRPSERNRDDPKNPRNYSLYTVKRSDTLTSIARLRTGLTVADMVWLNDLDSNRPLRIGQKVKLPH